MSGHSTERVLRGGAGLADPRANALRVVSMPCGSVFDRQDAACGDSVLAPALPAVAVEAAHPDIWRKYVGRGGAVVGIATFSESAPAADPYAHFGITADAMTQAVPSRLTA